MLELIGDNFACIPLLAVFLGSLAVGEFILEHLPRRIVDKLLGLIGWREEAAK